MSLPNPVGRQREVLYLSERGHTVVLGTAGSGKTTLAILRAAYLAKGYTTQGRKVLLVTFNRALVTFLESLTSSTIHELVDVRTYHKFALGYLSHKRGKGISLLDTDIKPAVIQAAVIESRQANGPHAIYARPIEMLSTEFEWLAKAGIRSAEDYVKSQRVGRAGTRVSRSDRGIIYDIYQRYLRLRSERHFDYDYDDLSLAVADEFAADETPRMYQHIVIDEGQDFSPAMLRSLAAAVPADGSLMFFGDVAQQVYGTRISWRSAGLRSPRIWHFEQNYRNSKQIAQLGIAISKMPFFQGEVDLVSPREPRAEGPLPTLVHCSDKDGEFGLAVELAMRMRQTQTVAILMRNRDMESAYADRFRSEGVSIRRVHRNMRAWTSRPGILLGTYHAAKGLEFDSVILPYCSADVIPDRRRATALGDEDDALAEEGRLLYVAVTRARTNLIISYSGMITPLLPADDKLYQKVER